MNGLVTFFSFFFPTLSMGISEFLPGVFGTGTKFLFDTKDLVVFGETLGTAGSTGFDLSSGKTNYQVGNECVLGFTGSVRNHGTPARALGELVSIDRFRHAADLVDLKEQAVASFLFNSGLDSEI